ncbi:MAG: hypothetical protein LBT97_09370 [Planctomycetota bacterium]|nr:hypothetical protein [Planctomycetota bacterium]
MDDSASDLQKRLEEVARRERAVARRERAVDAKSIKHNLYERMNLSLGAVNAVIILCVVALAVLIALGICLGPGR